MLLSFIRLSLDILGVITALVAVVYAYFKWTYQYWSRRGVPYLEPSIPFGNMPSIFDRTVGLRDRLCDLYDEAKSRGWRYIGIYSMARPMFMPLDLELIKHIMTKDFSTFIDRGMYLNEKDDPISAHLFNLGGKRWRNLRVKLTPTFTSGKLKAMFQTLVDCGLVMEVYIEKSVHPGDPVDIKEVLGRFSTNIIGSCAFGIECNTFKEPDSPFRVYSKRFLQRTKLSGIIHSIAQSFPKLGNAFGVCTTQKDVAEFFTKVVEDTVNYRIENNHKRKDLLQLLIDMKSTREGGDDGFKEGEDTLTMKEIIAQCFLFFIAGFETSSTTMTFALYELATKQDVQDKVREELNETLAKHDGQVTYDSLNELKYMKQVIDETLRVYPPVPFITRQCVDDYKVPGEDIVLEKGTLVNINAVALHYDKEYFENPKLWNPDRFSEENKKKIPHYAYLPFGEGPRVCIGERFGVMQTKVGMACLLRKFRVTLNEKTQQPIKLIKNFLPVVQGGIWLNLEKL